MFAFRFLLRLQKMSVLRHLPYASACLSRQSLDSSDGLFWDPTSLRILLYSSVHYPDRGIQFLCLLSVSTTKASWSYCFSPDFYHLTALRSSLFLQHMILHSDPSTLLKITCKMTCQSSSSNGDPPHLTIYIFEINEDTCEAFILDFVGVALHLFDQISYFVLFFFLLFRSSTSRSLIISLSLFFFRFMTVFITILCNTFSLFALSLQLLFHVLVFSFTVFPTTSISAEISLHFPFEWEMSHVSWELWSSSHPVD